MPDATALMDYFARNAASMTASGGNSTGDRGRRAMTEPKDIPNSYFEVTATEEARPAIRALRQKILDVCEGHPGDLCTQALMEALADTEQTTETPADVMNVVTRLLVGVVTNVPPPIAEHMQDIPLPAGNNRTLHDEIVRRIVAAVQSAFPPSTTFLPVEAIAEGKS